MNSLRDSYLAISLTSPVVSSSWNSSVILTDFFAPEFAA